MKTLGKTVRNLLIVGVASVGLLWGMDKVSGTLAVRQEEQAVRENFSGLLEAQRYEAMDAGDAEGIVSAYRALDESGAVIGYAVTVQVKGYGGDLEVKTALSPDASRFIGLRVGRNSETMGYGSRVTEEAFYGQFTALAAPASVGGYTGIDEPGDTSAPPVQTVWADGEYRAQKPDYDGAGYRAFVELTISGGKITAVNWDADKRDSDSTKKAESLAGRYVMTEDGPGWHEQAQTMENALLSVQDPAKLVYNEADGKTDAYAGVSVSVGEFVELAAQALAEAAGQDNTVAVPGDGGTVDAVSGATVSSKAVVRAANLAYRFVRDAAR